MKIRITTNGNEYRIEGSRDESWFDDIEWSPINQFDCFFRVKTYHKEEVEYLFMSFRISDTTHIYNAVVNSFKNAGFMR